jgi:hypothetical protein
MQLEADPVVQPTRQWRNPLSGGVRAGGGARSPVDELVRQWRSLRAGGARSPVEEPSHWWSRASMVERTRRWRSPLAGAPLSGGTGVEGSAADPGSGGAVEDVCRPRHYCGVTGPGRSPRRTHPRRRCWPMTVAWMAHRCAVLRRDRHGSVGGESWTGRSRGGWGCLQTMWSAAAWWNPSSYGTPFI